MRFEIINEKTLKACGIAAPLQEAIAAIPNVVAQRDQAAERLYPEPGESLELGEDWAALIRPELAHLFQAAEDTVRQDLRTLKQSKEKDGFEILIPLAHLEAWLNCLNQARLILAEQIDYTEEDHGRELQLPPQSARDLALFQMELYGLMQEWMIRVIEHRDGMVGDDDDQEADPHAEADN